MASEDPSTSPEPAQPGLVAMPDPPPARSVAIEVLKYAVVVGALAYLVASGRLDASHLKLRDGGGWPLAGVATLMFTSMILGFVRFWLLLTGAATPLSLARAIRMGFIGNFFNTFLLGGVGGDAVKLLYVARETGQTARALATIAVDRVLGLMGLFLVAGVALVLQWGAVTTVPGLWQVSLAVFGTLGAVVIGAASAVTAVRWGRTAGAALALALSAAGLAAAGGLKTAAGGVVLADLLVAMACVAVIPSLRPGRTLEGLLTGLGSPGHKMMSLVRSLLMFKDAPGPVVGGLALSCGIHVACLYALHLSGQALSLAHPPSLGAVMLAAPPALVANALPVPGGGLGVGEVAFAYLLELGASGTGSPVTGGAAIFLTLRFVTLVLGLVGFPFYIGEGRGRTALGTRPVTGPFVAR